MKVKLDENIPAGLVGLLGGVGHEVDTVPDEGLQGRIDQDIWAAAQGAGAFLITQDMDFSDVRRFRPGTHRGLMLMRLREPGARALTERIRAIFDTEPVDQWRGCLVVVTDRKVRIRWPGG